MKTYQVITVEGAIMNIPAENEDQLHLKIGTGDYAKLMRRGMVRITPNNIKEIVEIVEDDSELQE